MTEALARHSLVQLDPAGDGPRCRMLETIRVFVAERLAARADAAEVQRRHAGYYRALAGEAEPHLRGVGQAEWLDRLQAEAGNLAAAVDWYLSHDRAPLPHLFRALLPYWLLASEILGQARAWIGQLLPAAGSLDPQARAELLWAAAATANQAGDGAAALAASQQLEPLLAVSLAAYSTQNVTLVLAAFAGLAFAEGDLERAALLAGAVDGLRRRARPGGVASGGPGRG